MSLVGDPILLDSGPSGRGWHRLEAFLRCPMFYYWKYVHPRKIAARGLTLVPEEPALPLARGSIGHVGLAHYYARMRAVQRGEDMQAYYSPDAAMEIVSRRFPQRGQMLFDLVAPIVHHYADHYAAERWNGMEVLAVEEPIETGFHGYQYTARIDLVTRENGKVWFYDHKFVNKVEDKTLRRYTLSGQFLGHTWLGARTCRGGQAPRFDGEFGGVKLNLIGVVGSRFFRVNPDPAPWTLRRFPEIVKSAEEQIAALEGVDVEKWPSAPSELTCYTPYGECDYFEKCRWGEASP